MSTHPRAAEGDMRRCPHCRGTLTLTRRPVLNVATRSVRTGTEPHNGSDRLEYVAAWVCQNPKCNDGEGN